MQNFCYFCGLLNEKKGDWMPGSENCGHLAHAAFWAFFKVIARTVPRELITHTRMNIKIQKIKEIFCVKTFVVFVSSKTISSLSFIPPSNLWSEKMERIMSVLSASLLKKPEAIGG
jgi:hypothetical protein